jgi:hypothetical protein
MPSAWTMVFGFCRSLLRHLRGGMQKASFAEYARRLSVCSACPSQLGPINRRCKECGCNVRIKARWKNEKCPLGKWEAKHN